MTVFSVDGRAHRRRYTSRRTRVRAPLLFAAPAAPLSLRPRPVRRAPAALLLQRRRTSLFFPSPRRECKRESFPVARENFSPATCVARQPQLLSFFPPESSWRRATSSLSHLSWPIPHKFYLPSPFSHPASGLRHSQSTYVYISI